MTESLHKLGEVLRNAREARGIDLGRVERDTKIRSRYLSALEAGEYRELPGTVYTKGFLRNYGTYLGLDPEYLVDLYRLETAGAVAERPSPAPPRPMTVRRARALVVTPGAIAAAILTVAVIAFVGYLVYEFVTFARTPDLRITSPAGDVANYRQTEYTIIGVTEPNAQVTVDGLRENPVVTADAAGKFEVVVKLVPGSNLITLVANDPVTHRDSSPQTRTIEVDLSSPSPTPGSGIAITTPQDNATVSGPVTVAGTGVPGSTVHVVARLTAAAAPGFTIKTASGVPVKIPAQPAGATVAADVKVGADGRYTTTLALAAGPWQLAASVGVGPTASPASSPSPSAGPAATRSITVKAGAGLSGTLSIAGGSSYLYLLQDNVPLAGISGQIWATGKRIPLTAARTILIRAGNAGVVTVTISGIRIGLMGTPGQVVEWHIQAAG